jgi:hypothetical protein
MRKVPESMMRVVPFAAAYLADRGSRVGTLDPTLVRRGDP